MNKLIQIYIEKFNYFFISLLVILFPLNQQLHIRPFPSIDGVIIDYLMIKISIPEILLIFLTIFNFPNIIKSINSLIKETRKSIFLILIVFLLTLWSVFQSNYRFLAIYENLIILLILLNSITLKYYVKIDFSYLIGNSIKFWMVILLILGLFQVYFQESVLDNYYYFGEFTYSGDNYHIKQRGLIFENLIPAYGIFSHSNIYGAFFLISIMFLHLLKKENLYFVSLGLLGVILSGSMNILIGLIIFFIFYYLKIPVKFLIFYIVFLFIALNFYSGYFQKYYDDLSIYRRLYMVDLSNKKFVENPVNTLFGFGYYNYFREVSEDLYFYEIIRFFQPPHNVFYFIIWNYGLIFLITLLYLTYSFLINSSRVFLVFSLVLISVSMFDHFLFTNHQLKMLLFLILPYSLNKVFSIKIN